MSAKEATDKTLVRDRIDPKNEDSTGEVQTVKRRRTGPRQFESAGPLGFLQNIKIPGFHLRLANVNGQGGKNPYRIQELISDNVAYDFVHRDEVPEIQHSELVDLADSKVKIKVGPNDWAYLLKLPIDYFNEDLKTINEMNSSQVVKSADGNQVHNVMTTSSVKIS